MKNKKGFTLIELLAVIVVLAVIMVIAVPKILDVINSSRNSAAESSIKLVKDAIKTQVTTGQMSGVNFEKTGECYLFDFENNNNNALNLSLKNKDKIGGSVKYCNGKFEEDTLTFDGTSVSGGGNGGEIVKVCKRATTLHSDSKATYGQIGTNGTLTSGDAFDCDVNGDETYDSEKERFYYVTDLEENSNVAVLIYYNNVSGGEANNSISYAYISKDNYISSGGTESDYGSYGNWNKGPLTAIKQLPNTSKWSNVSLKNTSRNIKDETGTERINNFSYEGYAARLLTYQEMTRVCGTDGVVTTGYLNNCKYLMENTYYSNNSLLYGYWLESPYSYSENGCWHIRGIDINGGVGYVSDDIHYGVRPVIEVLKSDIEY